MAWVNGKQGISVLVLALLISGGKATGDEGARPGPQLQIESGLAYVINPEIGEIITLIPPLSVEDKEALDPLFMTYYIENIRDEKKLSEALRISRGLGVIQELVAAQTILLGILEHHEIWSVGGMELLARTFQEAVSPGVRQKAANMIRNLLVEDGNQDGGRTFTRNFNPDQMMGVLPVPMASQKLLLKGEHLILVAWAFGVVGYETYLRTVKEGEPLKWSELNMMAWKLVSSESGGELNREPTLLTRTLETILLRQLHWEWVEGDFFPDFGPVMTGETNLENAKGYLTALAWLRTEKGRETIIEGFRNDLPEIRISSLYGILRLPFHTLERSLIEKVEKYLLSTPDSLELVVAFDVVNSITSDRASASRWGSLVLEALLQNRHVEDHSKPNFVYDFLRINATVAKYGEKGNWHAEIVMSYMSEIEGTPLADRFRRFLAKSDHAVRELLILLATTGTEENLEMRKVAAEYVHFVSTWEGSSKVASNVAKGFIKKLVEKGLLPSDLGQASGPITPLSQIAEAKKNAGLKAAESGRSKGVKKRPYREAIDSTIKKVGKRRIR